MQTKSIKIKEELHPKLKRAAMNAGEKIQVFAEKSIELRILSLKKPAKPAK